MAHRILVLEDDDILRATLEEALEEEDYTVFAAPSSKAALELARMHRFDLMVADVRMEGMDGIECLGCLKALQPNARSIVITGYASQDAPTRAMKVQAEDYLHKPFSLDDFLEAVERVLSAEQERSRYSQLFDKVKAGARKMVEAVTQAAARTGQNSLETQREEAFRCFYVGVRSRLLGPDQARASWEKVHILELKREGLLQNSATTGSEFSQLAGGYQQVTEFIQALSNTDMYAVVKSSQVAPHDFACLYRNVLNSVVSPEQLKLAAFLYARSVALREHSPALEQLYNRIWREPAS